MVKFYPLKCTLYSGDNLILRLFQTAKKLPKKCVAFIVIDCFTFEAYATAMDFS